jgi:acyl-[acyl-carrier-protein]-phospholipid O-acyltransferase / long-chain-fatty-acid--[acyl-carrier-protein] ligase
LLCATKSLPLDLLIKLFKVPVVGGDREAALLFTSGSAGEPKGVILTHSNILGNIEQLDSYGVLSKDDKVMSCLPFFHSFGFTVTLFYAMIKGLRVVTSPNPLQVATIIQAIEEEKATVHIGTPTFFRPYLKKATREQLSTLRAVVAGAEKTPEGFHDMWESRFGNSYLEGYGLTETSPVVACNLPVEGKYRKGSVGKLFPGMAARVLNSETGEPQSIYKQGILCLKGCNVFAGYLDNPSATAEAIDSEGWFITGDLARMDEDGFLYIEGRLSRFSKIAGEMVPHGTVEQAIAKAYGVHDSEDASFVVTGKADDEKGEVLILVSTLEIDISKLREKLSLAEIALPNLWIPRLMVKVEKIPLLASGKLDIKAIRRIALEDIDINR